MRHQDISEGDRILFTFGARQRYGIEERGIVVDRLTYRDGYKTPHVWDNVGRAFEPRDFERKVSNIPGESLIRGN